MEEAEDTRKYESERETQQEREDKIAGDPTRTRAGEKLDTLTPEEHANELPSECSRMTAPDLALRTRKQASEGAGGTEAHGCHAPYLI